MADTYTEKVVSARSRDGFLIEGLVIAPAAPVGPSLLWIHGVYAAFYAPPGLEVCRALAQLGVTCVLGNTRGHNVGAWIPPRREKGCRKTRQSDSGLSTRERSSSCLA